MFHHQKVFQIFLFILVIFFSLNLNALAGGLEVTLGTWYLKWEQNDNTDNPDITTDIYHQFSIKNSFAKELALSGDLDKVRFGMNYIFTEKTEELEQTVSTAQKASRILGYLNINWGGFSTYARYIYAHTEGKSEAVDPKTLQTAFVKFSTDLHIGDLIFYPYFFLQKGINLGIGYRFLDYTLPQSLYILGAGQVTGRLVEPNMNWKAHFITCHIESYYEEDKELPLRFYGSLMGGYALKVEPTSESVEKAGYKEYLNGKLGYFYEWELGIIYFKKFGKRYFEGFYIKAGYRSSRYVLETEKDKDVYIYARAESKFSGPFINLTLSF